MLQRDFDIINEMLTDLGADESTLQGYEKYGIINLFLRSQDVNSLEDVDIENDFIGYATGQSLEEGQTFINPYDKYSFLRVVEFDEDQDRALVEIIATD